MNCAQAGAPGTGKSQSLLTLVPFTEASKKPFVIIDADNKLGDNPDFKKPIADGKFVIMVPGTKTSEGSFEDKIKRAATLQPPKLAPQGWIAVGSIMDDLETNHNLFCGVALDTITSVEDHIKKYIAFTNKRGKFEYADWESLLLSWKELFNTFYSLDIPLKILNMHTQYEKDDLTGKVTLLPLMTGSFRNQAGRDMSEFYQTFAKPNVGKPPTYMWQVAPDSRFIARSVVFKNQIEVVQDWTPVWQTLLQEEIHVPRSVTLMKGNRKKDQSVFYGLKFTADNHSGAFLTPGQFRTVLALAEEAKVLLRNVPRLSAAKKEQ